MSLNSFGEGVERGGGMENSSVISQILPREILIHNLATPLRPPFALLRPPFTPFRIPLLCACYRYALSHG